MLTVNPNRLAFFLFSALFTVHSASVEAAQNTPVADSKNAVVKADVLSTKPRTDDLMQPKEKQYVQLAAQNQPTQEQLQKEYQQALNLARAQQYDKAIAKFKWLRTVDPGNLKFTFDYITVLCWSGDYSGAIGLYEKLLKVELPAYVRRDISGAYNRTGQYGKAIDVLQPLADKGDRQARLWQAEMWMKLGDKVKGNGRYDELLAQDANDASVYMSRGSYALQAEDYRQAVWDFERALHLIPSTATEQVRQIREQLAAAYINIQQFKKAVTILNPYIHSKMPSSPSMQGNYIVALKNDGQYEVAAREAQTIWPRYNQAPVFGLRALAECYIKLKRNEEAIKIYQHLVQRMPDSETDQLVLGFRLMIEGKLVQSLAVYDQLLQDKPQSAPLILADASSLLSTENYVYGKALFELVLRYFPNNPAYCQQYAKALDSSLLHQSSYRQYEILSHFPDYEVAGLTGMARSSIAGNDYVKAQQALTILKERYGRSKAVAALSSQYDNRLRNDVESSYVINSSYKQLRSMDWQTTATQNMGGNYSFLANFGRTRLDDFGAQESQVLINRKVGIGYDDMTNSMRLWVGQGQDEQHFSTFSLSDNYSINDQYTLHVNFGRQPVADVQALQPQNSGTGGTIFSKSAALGFSYAPSLKENMQFTWSRSLFTDQNRSTGYSLEHNYSLYDQNGQSLSRNLYWNRLYFANQNSVYDCPEIRESLGVGWTWRNGTPSGYWLGRFVLNWDRDYPDKLALGPYVRLEYGYNLSRNHSLTIGAEYGTRTQNVWGKGGLHYGYRQFDILYHANW